MKSMNLEKSQQSFILISVSCSLSNQISTSTPRFQITKMLAVFRVHKNTQKSNEVILRLMQFLDFELTRNFNSEQNIWSKSEKSSRIEQGKKSLISTFAGFLTAIAKVYFCEKYWALGCLHSNLRIFQYLLIS